MAVEVTPAQKKKDMLAEAGMGIGMDMLKSKLGGMGAGSAKPEEKLKPTTLTNDSAQSNPVNRRLYSMSARSA